VTRLRNHPSLAHWNGNNEIAVAWHHWGWQREFGYSPSDSTRQWQDYLHLFEKLIPDKIRQLDPSRSYTPTSPLSNWGKPKDFLQGSMHYWGVWHGQEDFEAYPRHVGRFMAEYGFQSFPDTTTLAKFAPRQDWYLDSPIMRHHQKSYIGNAMIHRMVQQYLGQVDDFTDWVMRSQEVQALAMEKAIDAHRWERARCGGTLFWQLNDCWPGPSWSAIDVYGREKILFQQLPHFFAPIALLGRTTGHQLELRLANDRLEVASVIVQMVGRTSEEVLWEKAINAQANSLSTIFQGPKPSQPVSLRVMEGAQLLYERPLRE
jgi:beta-mannosidase